MGWVREPGDWGAEARDLHFAHGVPNRGYPQGMYTDRGNGVAGPTHIWLHILCKN